MSERSDESRNMLQVDSLSNKIAPGGIPSDGREEL